MTSSDGISPDLQITFAELCISANISPDYIVELIEFNLIAPISGKGPQEWEFNVSAMAVVNKAARLHRDLEIDWADIGLVLNLLQEIDQLKAENKQLQNRVDRLLSFRN